MPSSYNGFVMHYNGVDCVLTLVVVFCVSVDVTRWN